MRKIYLTLAAVCICLTFANSQSSQTDRSDKGDSIFSTSTNIQDRPTTNNRAIMDSDADGVVDAIDLDDDNDGIPDAAECGGISGGFINGDFESPAGFNSGNRYLTEYIIPGWKTTASDKVMEIWYSGNGGVTAQNGNYFSELNANEVSNIYQELYLPTGTIINWSLYHRGRNGVDTALIKIGPSLVGLIHQDSLKDDTLAWGFYTGSYTIPAAQPVTILAIESSGVAGNDPTEGNLLDHIQITISNVGGCDTDNDGINNSHDLDSDNDGIPDIIEAGGVDTDGDGRVEYVIAGDPTSMNDLDGDGLMDTYDSQDTGGPTGGWVNGNDISYPDSDGDGFADVLDIDADQDGIPDLVEVGGIDTIGDGRLDDLTDDDSDGFANIVDPNNESNPGVNESSPLIITGGDSGNGTPTIACPDCDTDLDGLPDFIDLDSDNDGIPDLVEVKGIDENGDGLEDFHVDIDADGLIDDYDEYADDGPGPMGTSGMALVETDASGALRTGDKITDLLDFDADLIPDYLDLDADNDGIPDLVEAGAADGDNDGMVDTSSGWDSDGDGLADIYDESVPAGTALIKTTADTNGDERLNIFIESMLSGIGANINTDNDNVVNHIDFDSDNDGIVDVVENASGDVAADDVFGGTRDGKIYNFTDGNDDGWNDGSSSTETDTDGDTVPDYLDSDSDNDGIPDFVEGVCTGCPTENGPAGNDDNNNGVLNMYESLNDVNLSGTQMGVNPNNDNNSSNAIVDYLDTDTDSDGAYDWSEAFDINGNSSVVDEYQTIAANYEGMNGYGYYTTDDQDLDNIPDFMDNQFGTAGYIEGTPPPFLEYGSGYWHDEDGDGLVDLFDFSENGTSAPLPDNNIITDKDWRDGNQSFFLPVTLTEFYVEKENCFSRLFWTTTTEENFDHFELEWSKTGSYFLNIHQVQSAGRGIEQRYSHLHRNTASENYYRLKMIDKDGQVNYSDVIRIGHLCNLSYGVQLYPNPVSKGDDQLQLKFYAEQESTVATLYDVLGRNIQEFQLDVNLEWNLINVNIADLSAGTYYFKLGEYRKAIQFVVLE